MDNVANYKAFVEDKLDFFAKVDSMKEATTKAHDHSFTFLSNNETFLEEEFLSTFANLQAVEHRRQGFVLYCYYCCLMLENYYSIYDHPENKKKYNKFRLQMAAMWENKEPTQVEYDSFFKAMGKNILASLQDLITTPVHTSKLKSKIGFLNICRIYWVFDKLVLINGFTLAEKAKLIDQINNLFGKTIDVDNVIKTLEAPAEIFRVLSVGYFVARLTINAILILKHTFFPNDKEDDLTSVKRFTHQIRKRHPELLNDIVWATNNGLCNYSAFFHIAAPVAAWLTVGGLIFDISLFVWMRRLAEKEYLTQCEKYEFEKNLYRQKMHSTDDVELMKKYLAHYDMLEKQSIELEIKWQTTNATFWFKITAALFLATGFAASILFVPGVLVLASYAVCLLGVAMLLSADDYAMYKEKSLRLQYARLYHEDEAKAQAEYNIAVRNFIFTMAKNIILPTLVIAAFIVSWQAAVVICTAYLAFELYRAYSKHTANKPVPKAIIKDEDAKNDNLVHDALTSNTTVLATA